MAIGRPVVIGTSRKSFLGKLAGGRDETHRLPGTIATNVLALERGATSSECTTSPRTSMPCGWPLLLSGWMWEREPDDDYDELDDDELDDERGASLARPSR